MYLYSDLVVTRNSEEQLLLLEADLVIHHPSALLLAEAERLCRQQHRL